MSRLNLKGVIPAVVLPMTADYEPDLPAYKRYLDWVISQGPVALAINVDTGEGPHLSREERQRVLEAAVGVAAGRVSIIAGVGGPYTVAAITAARDAKEIGADAVLMFPISVFQGEPLDPEVPYQYHKAVADAVDIPQILFQLQPALGGINYSCEALLKLIEIDTVVAIKEASFDAMRFRQTKAILEQAPRRITLLTGNDNLLLESYILGAEGALIGFGTIATDLQVQMYHAWFNHDIEEAFHLAEIVQPLSDSIFAPPVRNYRARTKEAFVMMGILNSAVTRPPLLPISDAERADLRRALAKARLIKPVTA
ncbi:MAG: dihydrodipicolinate synthase family protein [Candidatus Binatia bacterium]